MILITPSFQVAGCHSGREVYKNQGKALRRFQPFQVLGKRGYLEDVDDDGIGGYDI